MQEKVYKYVLSMRTEFEPWLIRTYLHRRIYNVLLVITKVFPLYNIFVIGLSTPFDYGINAFIFFYFEVYLLYKYFAVKSRFKRLYGDNFEVKMYLNDDEMLIQHVNGEYSVKWEEMTRITETKWFFFIYKNGVVHSYFYKRPMSEEDKSMVKDYLRSQSNREGLNVYLNE